MLSRHQARPRPEASHERRIITEAPNVMWATNATRITTVRDGMVWLRSLLLLERGVAGVVVDTLSLHCGSSRDFAFHHDQPHEVVRVEI